MEMNFICKNFGDLLNLVRIFISVDKNIDASTLLLSQWNIDAQTCYAVNNFSFYSFHSDDAFCALLPEVNAHEFKSFSAVQIYDLSYIHLRALYLSR